MNIETVPVGQLDTNCFIISDEETRETLIIDPGDDPDRISAFVDSNSLSPKYVIFTHAHYDHVCAAREMKDRYDAAIVMHEAEDKTYENTIRLCISWGYEAEDFPQPDVCVKEADQIWIGRKVFTVMHTPGHTPGGICLYGNGLLLTGDTLFRGSAGRTDLPGGDWDLLLSSLRRLILLPPPTRIYCGHGDETTIGLEMRTNPFLLALQ